MLKKGTIMGKRLIKITMILFFCIMILTGCVGNTDYTISLNNDYYIAKTSAHNAKIYKVEDKDESGKAPSIPIYHGNDEEFEKESVIKVGQDNRYIIAETNKDKYYILDTKEESVLEFSSKEEFEENETDKSLAELLKENRMKCKMTQEFVSERLGVSRQAVSKWENGSTEPSTSNLIALAKLYDVSAEELLKNATKKNKN